MSYDLQFGYSALKQYGGVISDDFLAKLNGRRGVMYYDEMRRNSSVCGAILNVFETLMLQATWRFEPVDDSPAAIGAADFYNGLFADMAHGFPELLEEALTMLPFGWAFMEVVWKLRDGQSSRYSDGKIGIKKIALRPQDSLHHWEFNDCDEVVGMWQQSAPDYTLRFVPTATSLLFRTKSERNNPEGRSIFRSAARSYAFIKQFEEVEAVGYERQLAGLPVFYVPKEIMSSTATADQQALRTTLETIAMNIRNNERKGLVLPSPVEPGTGQPTGFDFKLVAAAGGSHQVDIRSAITGHQVNIFQNSMCQFLQLGVAPNGSRSLADNQTDHFSMSCGAFMDKICNVIDRQLTPKIGLINGIPQDLWPDFVHSDIEIPSLGEFANYVQTMANIGFNVKTPEIERQILQMAKLPVEEV